MLLLAVLYVVAVVLALMFMRGATRDESEGTPMMMVTVHDTAPNQPIGPITRQGFLNQMAFWLYECVRPENGLAWYELTPGQRAHYRDECQRLIDEQDKTGGAK